jgi:hypothetical protein
VSATGRYGMRVRLHNCIPRAHRTSLSSSRMNTPGPLHVIIQAVVSAACASGHTTHRALCDLLLEAGCCQR